MSRVRSPNYPAMSLPVAVERTRALHKAESRNAMTREVIARHIGFGSLNGASATAVSALMKYGLLERAGEGEMRVSPLAMRILYPHDDAERSTALREAALHPDLFSKIHEKWPERAPSDENLRAFLVRENFAQGAVDQIIKYYRETIDIAGLGEGSYGSHHLPQKGQTMAPQSPQEVTHLAPPPFIEAATATAAAMQMPLDGRPFTVSFDGSVITGSLSLRSAKDIDRLMRVLQAQKAALVAMQDDEDDEERDLGREAAR